MTDNPRITDELHLSDLTTIERCNNVLQYLAVAQRGRQHQVRILAPTFMNSVKKAELEEAIRCIQEARKLVIKRRFELSRNPDQAPLTRLLEYLRDNHPEVLTQALEELRPAYPNLSRLLT